MRPYPSASPVINIAKGTFYRHHPNSTVSRANPAIFKDLDFTLPSSQTPSPRHWYIVGPSLSGKTTFLNILQGQHLCFPPTARTYPFLSEFKSQEGGHVDPGSGPSPRHNIITKAIRYVGFNNDSFSSSTASATHLSARYESKRLDTDFSLRDYLTGNTELNPLEKSPQNSLNLEQFDQVVRNLRLTELLDLPVMFLSNGQGRRARIARALLTSPDVLLLDEPFMGLDPPTVAGLSPLLHELAKNSNPRLVLSARPQDPIPDWITHLVYLRSDLQVGAMGPKENVLKDLGEYARGVSAGKLKEDPALAVHNLAHMGKTLTSRGIHGQGLLDSESSQAAATVAMTGENETQVIGEPVVEMDGCKVQYGGKVVLGNWDQEVNGTRKDGLLWTVRRGERWGVFGPNGSGKTTVVSLLCSDHPQTYSLPIKLFGRSRLPERGSGELPLTFWDIQARIGHSSPEIHQHMPRNITVRRVLESAWADTFRSRPNLDEKAKQKVDATLSWFEAELNPTYSTTTRDPGLSWADYYMFGELSFSAQRVALFLRAIIKNPDIVVLDEACSGMDDGVRNRCLLFLEHGQRKTIVTNENGSESIVDSNEAETGHVSVEGLTENQALICISHIREEIPDCIREWICLPEANSGEAARFGVANAPLGTDQKSWNDIWAMDNGA